MATRCCSPPERRGGRWCNRSPRPTWASSSRARGSLSVSPQLGRQHDVFQGAQGGQQQERLEHEPHLLGPQPGASLLVQPGEGVAEDLYLAAARQIETGQQTEQGGLAGTGRTDQRQRLAGIDLQIDPFKDGEAFLTEANGFTEPLTAIMGVELILGILFA